jgi:pimeloyl-ACP methyl ester carboxylesterase
MTMKQFIQLAAGAIAPVLFLTSCGSPPGMTLLDTPLTNGPILSALFNPDKLTPETQAYLEEQDLARAYHQDPSTTIIGLRKGLTADSSSQHRAALIELCSDQGDRLAKSEPNQAVGYHLTAAELAFPSASASQASDRNKELRAAYNHSSGQVARILFDSGHAWEKTTALQGPGKSYRLRSRTSGRHSVDPRQFDELNPAEYLEFRDVELERIRREGMGAAMVGHRRGTPERRQQNPLLPPVGMSLPVNVTLEFSKDGSKVDLAFHNLLDTDKAVIAGKTQSLSADLTAPFGLLLNHKVEHNSGWKGMVHPEEYLGKMGLFQLEPYRPDQIPVILVHGLMSSPETWLTALNQLRSDPELRNRYQLLVFRYPTGFPIVYNAMALRQRIAAFQKQVDPTHSNPHMRNMILIGHSMGGILSNMQIRDSGDTITDLAFTRPIDDVVGLSPKVKEGLKELAIYKANPDITRAIFLASPHRGSEGADNPLVVLGSKLIKFSRNITSKESIDGVEGLTPLGKKFLTHRPDSIHGLRPNAVGTATVLTQKVRKGVTIHSIIGRKKPSDPLLESGDGIVPYWSSHLDGVQSEKVVHATHTSINHNQDAIKEVGRILYLHAGLRPKQ